MNKISKKIVSLVTMAAFALTLVPAAAFAVTADNVDPGKSSVATIEKNVQVEIGDRVDYKLNLKDINGAAVGGAGQQDNNVETYVWVEDAETHEVIRDVVYYDGTEENNGQEITNPANIAWIDDGRAMVAAHAYDSREMSLAINEDGNYVIKAGVVKNDDITDVSSRNDLTTLNNVTNYSNIEVSVPVTAGLELRDQNRTVLTPDETDTVRLNLTDATVRDGFKFNGSDVYTIYGKAVDEEGQPIANKTFSLITSRTDVVEFVEDTVTTDAAGEFTVQFSMQDQKNCTLTIANVEEGIDYTVRVVAAVTTAKNINRTLENGYVLAGADEHWTELHRVFSDAVQFEILDDKGDAITGSEVLDNEPAADSDNGDHQNCVRIMSKPEKSDMNANDIVLYWDGENYTLRYNGSYERRTEVLVPGEYTVRVSLASGDNATVSFTVAKFGTVKNTELDMYALNLDWNWADPEAPFVVINDEVTLDQQVRVVASYVDENGIKVPADGVWYGFNGDAVTDANPANGTFRTEADTEFNASLLGSTIEVTAFNAANKQLVQETLTVVDSYFTKSLEFDPTEGPVNEDNDVTVSVVNEDGDVATSINGIMSAYVADQSNEEAKVSLDVPNGVHNGKGTLTIYSDKETTVDIVVAVKAGTEIYAGTLEYTVGAEDPLADRTVVMTIDSVDYVVNNNVITGDAAPYVDDNWRTMVPIRALAEAFDAEVVWDQDDETVTINFDGGTRIVMTVGETTYTINGDEATMDTEPVNTGSRVYVPIRFAAEGLGFSVTPLYNADGLTASVVFQR